MSLEQGSNTEALVLRLVYAAAMIATLGEDDSERVDEVAPGLLSALDYALRGSPGCLEPDEWQEDRRRALAQHGDYLELGSFVESSKVKLTDRECDLVLSWAQVAAQESAITDDDAEGIALIEKLGGSFDGTYVTASPNRS